MPAWISVRSPRLPYASALKPTVKPEHSWLARYSVAVISVLVALVLMLLLNPWVPMQGSPFLIFYAAVMISAWYGGLGPGGMAIALSTLAAKYFFIESVRNWSFASPSDVIRLIVFILVSLLVCSLSATRRRLVSALRVEHDLKSAVISTAGSLILVLDRQGRIVEFNRACERTTGYSFAEVQGKYPWDLFLPTEEVDSVQEAFRKLRAGIYPADYEGTWITRAGDRRLIAWSNTVLLDDWNFVRFVISTGIDITDRKQAEKDLQETNQTLQALIHSAPLSITVVDQSGLVKLWNPAAERTFGWTKEEAHGEPLPTVPADRWKEFKYNISSTLRGELLNGIEVIRQRKDGTLVELALWTAALRGNTPQADSVMAIMADLSPLKRAEAALKLSQERLTSFFEGNIIGIVFGDLSGIIDQANDAFLQLIGYSREELENRELRWTDITPPEYADQDRQGIAEARESGACTPFEKEYIRKDGDRVPVLLGFTLLGDDRQQFIAFVLDLTERKRLEQVLRRQAEELAEANRMKDEFLAVLSHELRTPLNSMLGWSRLLQNRQLDAATTTRALETIERNARLQAQLIEDILDVSKMIRGKLRLHPRPIQLKPVVDAAIDSMRPTAEAKGVSLQGEFTPLSEVVMGDPDRLQQVFWNLLSNAIKFTPKGGRVEIRLSMISSPASLVEGSVQADDPQHQTQYAQVQVTDTGKGISPDFLPFVFDRFRQADSSITRNDGGLGLGLAIVRHLVELHGGSVWAESEGLGSGATFTVRLPLLGDRQNELTDTIRHDQSSDANPPAYLVNMPLSESAIAVSQVSADVTPLPQTQLLTGLKILLVDDEADIREALRAILGEQGAIVAVAASVAEALSLMTTAETNPSAEVWKPDVLISDLSMPHEDGYFLIRQVRQFQANHDSFTPALALTDGICQSDHKQALIEGFQMSLPKPIEPNTFIRALMYLTGRIVPLSEE